MYILEVQSRFKNNPTVKCLSEKKDFQITSSSIYKSECGFFFAIDANDSNNIVALAYQNTVAKIVPTKQPKEYDKSFSHTLLVLREKMDIAMKNARELKIQNQDSYKGWEAKYWELAKASKAIRDLAG